MNNNINKMRVLSLFDGRSTGLDALVKAKIPVETYYASEIDKYAEAVSRYHHPNIIRLGDVNNWKNWDIDFSKIDLLLAGFPCQSFSFAGNQLGFEDKRGNLAIVTVDIFRHIKKLNPNLKFLFENVKMKKEHSAVLNDLFGVDFREVNSNLVSAQNRKRYYWTNIDFEIPEDRGILLKDIVHENSDNIIHSPVKLTDRNIRHFQDLEAKSLCCIASMWKGAGNNGMTLVFEELEKYIVPFDKTLQILEKEVERGNIGYFKKERQANIVYYIHGKAVSLHEESEKCATKIGQDLFGGLTPDRVNKRQNGQRFNDGKKFYTLTAQDKHGILIEGYIRKITPIECERLQTCEDNSTKWGTFENGEVKEISNTQRYKICGNGWTEDVIAHILKNIKK